MKIVIAEKTNGTLAFSTHEVDGFTFSGGEEHLNFTSYKRVSEATITASICSSSDLIKLALLKDCLDEFGCPVHLILPYIPYARQDRRCQKGDPFSLGVFARILNGMNFNSVSSLDPHSDVAPALINNIKYKSLIDIINGSETLRDIALTTLPVAPDAGANKKVFSVAEYSSKEMIRADKIRDIENKGAIIGTEVYCDSLLGQSVTIWDDICDGGRTFTELAKVLKAKGARSINLYVTHGIFAKGIDILIESGIDRIFTTDSLPNEKHDRLTIIEA